MCWWFYWNKTYMDVLCYITSRNHESNVITVKSWFEWQIRLISRSGLFPYWDISLQFIIPVPTKGPTKYSKLRISFIRLIIWSVWSHLFPSRIFFFKPCKKLTLQSALSPLIGGTKECAINPLHAIFTYGHCKTT
jgi:hypothetical protein